MTLRVRAYSCAPASPQTLAKLAQFKSKLQQAQKDERRNSSEPRGEPTNTTTGYSGQVDTGETEADDAGWMTTELKFTRHIDDDFRDADDIGAAAARDPKRRRDDKDR